MRENGEFETFVQKAQEERMKDLIRSLRGSIEFEDKNVLLADLKKKRWEKGN